MKKVSGERGGEDGSAGEEEEIRSDGGERGVVEINQAKSVTEVSEGEGLAEGSDGWGELFEWGEGS